jgi:O-6-methylguanine DNA methyltransferase
MSFAEKVIEAVKQISKGEVRTYGEITEAAGSSGAARAVGSIMKQNRDKNIPCHRVICSSGKIGGYNGNLGKKKDLLEAEGFFVNAKNMLQFPR